MTEWISVNDRLPEHDEKVLATFKGQFSWVMFVASRQWNAVISTGYAPATHWQPLPEPPLGS